MAVTSSQKRKKDQKSSHAKNVDANFNIVMKMLNILKIVEMPMKLMIITV